MSKKKTRKEYRNWEKIRQRSAYENKPSLNRHKAHSSNRRKKRAAMEVKEMRKSAYRAMKRYGVPEYPHTELIEVYDAQVTQIDRSAACKESTASMLVTITPDPTLPLTAPDAAATLTPDNHNVNPILGGFKAWLRRITRHA